MRTAITGLVAVPVLVAGGLGIAAAVGVIDTPSPDSPRAADASTAAPPYTTVTGSVGGTAIDGAKPHLTVIDGRATLMLPGALPAILSVLSDRPTPLRALPSDTDRALPTSHTVDRAPTPGTRTTQVPHLQNPSISAVTDGDEWFLPTPQSIGEVAHSASQGGGQPSHTYDNDGDSFGDTSRTGTIRTDTNRSAPR